MNDIEIRAKAQALADAHIAEIEQERRNLVQTMKTAGYNPDEWVIMDNLEQIRQGQTYRYECWSSLKNPTGL